MVFVVLRHGESEWNKLNKFTGHIDVSLSEQGKNEARLAGNLLKDCFFDFIFSSQLERTIHTAKIIADIQNNPVQLKPRNEFEERRYGDITGKNKTELTKEYGKEQIMVWRRSFYQGPPGGESLYTVTQRVGKGFDEHIRPLLEHKKNVLLVAHGNSLRALFVHLGIKDEKTIETFEIGTGVPIQLDIENNNYKYMNAYELSAYQIIDSRGYPSLEVKCYEKESKKCIGKGSTPSGASCGSTEVCEMRDGYKDLFHGKSVFRAVENIRNMNDHFVLSEKTLANLSNCDKQFNDLDGTEMKTKYGGNTSTALSFCLANCAANLKNMEMYEYFAEHYNMVNKIDITHLPTPFVNIINVCPELYGRTIVVNGVSKAYSMTGWRIGYAAGPEKIIKEMKKIQSQSTSNPNSIAQAAAVSALNGKQDFIKECVSIFKERHDFIINAMEEIDDIKIIKSEGTFYAFPDMNNVIDRIHNISNDIELAEFFLDNAEVAMVPGSAFGSPGCMRISFATSMENIIEGMKRIKNAL